jgi:NADPH-dependent stearoyl-CoA 9-desaturase
VPQMMIESPLARLTDEQLEELGRAFDAIHDEVYEDLGDRDRRYITSMIELHRRLAVVSRVLLLASTNPAACIAGTAGLSAAKILENMEIGHNVLHGQWDWMNDPDIHSTTWDWDTASTSEAWKHSHNYVHHTYTNVLGKDKDLGYEIFRIDPHQRWYPWYLLQPFYNVLLMLFFEWGVALHDLDAEAIRKGEKSKEQLVEELKGIAGKARLQIQKDYISWPLVSALAAGAATAAAGAVAGERGRPLLQRALDAGKRTFKTTAKANAAANIVRNVWSNAIIFCGHFPDQAYVFTQEEVKDESRGAWYVRQLTGAANIDGSPLFHVASGNLSFQVEHHLFPDMPSSRYAEIAPRVKAICAQYGLPYNTGPFGKQWLTVQRTILRLAFPGGKPRPKPGPYVPEDPEVVDLLRNGTGQYTRKGGSGPEQDDAGVQFDMPAS